MVAGKLVEKGLNKVLPGAGKTVKEEGFKAAERIVDQKQVEEKK